MQDAVLIRLRPLGPWRYGPGDGGNDRVDHLYRSDRLYSALTLAMAQLGFLDEWLDATARAYIPAVTFSSLFPYQAETLFVSPPSTLWPPPPGLVTTPSPVFLSKLRWKAARFVPTSLVESIIAGQSVLADQWLPDPESGCLLRRDRPSTSPFRVTMRTAAAVDRVTHSEVEVSSAACIEFEPGAGLWTLGRFADSAAQSGWSERIKAGFRLLADTGFGGRRRSGWGQTAQPSFEEGAWPNLLVPKLARAFRNATQPVNGEAETPLYWLLSLYSPAPTDTVNWSAGNYETIIRGGRTESAAGPGAVKKLLRMVAEGSVIAAESEPAGTALNVAPDGFPHPVYRSGFALCLKLPSAQIAAEQPAEAPSVEEAIEPRPCEPPAPEEVTEQVEEEPRAWIGPEVEEAVREEPQPVAAEPPKENGDSQAEAPGPQKQEQPESEDIDRDV
jgi:CRISPR type III-A-associated RAMP protein Csm4